MSKVWASSSIFHADSDQISRRTDDDFLQMLQWPVWTPMEGLIYIILMCHGLLPSFLFLQCWAFIYCQQVFMMENALMFSTLCRFYPVFSHSWRTQIFLLSLKIFTFHKYFIFQITLKLVSMKNHVLIFIDKIVPVYNSQTNFWLT